MHINNYTCKIWEVYSEFLYKVCDDVNSAGDNWAQQCMFSPSLEPMDEQARPWLKEEKPVQMLWRQGGKKSHVQHEQQEPLDHDETVWILQIQAVDIKILAMAENVKPDTK